MRLLHTYLSVLLFAVVGGWAHAQTPTATPHPNALGVGMYQFESLASPEIELTGIDWSIRGLVNGLTGLGNDNIGETLTFWVTSESDYLMIYRDTKSSGVGEWNICIDAMCINGIKDKSGGGTEPLAFDLYRTNSEIVITKSDSDESIFDFMTIVLDPDSIESIAVSGTLPESTPEPYYIYGTVSGTDGNTIETRFDMVMTAGDVAITNALLFLFFSVWAIIIIMFFVSRDDV